MKQWANRFIWFLSVPMKRVFIALFFLIAVSIIPVSAFLPGNPIWKYIASSPKKIFLFDQTLYHIRDLGENSVMFTIGIRERQIPIEHIYRLIVIKADTANPQGRVIEYEKINLQSHKVIYHSSKIGDFYPVKEGTPLKKCLDLVVNLRNEGKIEI